MYRPDDPRFHRLRNRLWRVDTCAPPGRGGSANWSKLAQLLREEGKDPATFPNLAYHNININPDRRAALEESQRYLDAYYGPLFAPPMVEAWTAAGTPAECAEHLQQLAHDGAKTIALRITAWDQQGQFERMVGEVLPRVNEGVGTSKE